MMQEVVTFGPDHALVGILCSPETRHRNAPVVLLTNAGVLPRQGPHRMNVRIAHALAAQGVPSLRFDLSGHGDSLPIGNPGGIAAQALLDLKSAMDWAQDVKGETRFLAFGTCSSAVSGFKIALADERVTALMMFDGFSYKSRWTTLIRDVKRAMDADWRTRGRAIWRRIAGHQTADSSPEKGVELVGRASDRTPLSTFAEGLQILVDRDVDIMIVYGGSIIDYYSYAGQFRDVFGGYGFFPHVRCEFHPDIDHTFISRHAQKRMIDLTCEWVRTHLDRVENTAGAR